MASTTDLLSTWNRLGSRPGGAWIFHRLLARFVPYTGALGARVLELGDGRARVTLADRRRNRNHLGSVHAVALVNLGEMTSGLALITGLDADVRSILVKISAEYLKKARGTLTATAGIEIPKVTGPVDHVVEAVIRNEAEELVCRVEAVWRLDLRPAPRTERPGAATR
jgi:uncharacterized protein (TIGR00369 family)